MKNKITKILLVLVALVICVSSVQISVGAVTATVTASGECGDNLTWTLYSDGELVISGTGAMKQYFNQNDLSAPWSGYHSVVNSKVNSIRIEEGITTISDYAFYGCSKVKEIIVPSTVTDIGKYAFWQCSAATRIVIPDTVTSLKNGIFQDCDNLKVVTIGKNISQIDDGAFNYMNGIEEFVVDEENEHYTAIDGVLYSRDGTKLIKYTSASANTEYIMPEGTLEVGRYAFYEAVNLESIVFSEGITEITSAVFYTSANLKSITLPSTITKFLKEIVVSGVTIIYNGNRADWAQVEKYPSLEKYCTIKFLKDSYTTGVELDREWVELRVGEEVILNAIITPEDVEYRELIWKSSNEHIVVVEQDGTVKALSYGAAFITVETVDGGYTASCDIIVNIHSHTYNSGVITTQPTVATEGVKTYTCTVCGATKTEPIPKLEAPQYPEEQEPDGRIYAEGVRGKAGQNVTVDFYLETEKDVRMLSVYDIVYSEDVMELVSLEWAVANSTFTDFSDGIATVLMGENTNISGKLFTVTFKIKDGVADGVYGVSFANAVKYSVTGQADVALNVTSEKGGIEVYSIDPGDANGDEVVNADDAVLLLKSIMLPDRYEVLCEPDINADGVFNADDVVYILKHIMLPDRYPL